ncbi:hypothetical protein NLX67_20130 [Domibacillus sp. A3M-37]|uniref:hypothetical protein n=1 Tax=Domibacillus sp. A3M-37 TaxID=2962037 RepID=UPI0020B660F1|nr:hypothetical protein [Domibacillus sp. A3M-37]MCP3764652.1 hypothetical protein [Domibacillus sp. A3M-37]
MKEKVEGLKELLRNMEMLKSDVMARILELDDNAMLPPISTVYPGAKAKTLAVNGYPVYQFAYEGVLPLYQQDGKYRAAIRHYYFRATFEACGQLPFEKTFDKAAIFIIYYFKDQIIRDLDNRNRKFLMDAIRQTGLITDDSWRHLAVMEEGFHDPHGDHVQMYVLARENFTDFLAYMERHHRYEIFKPDAILKAAIFDETDCQKNRKSEEEKTKEIPVEASEEYRQIWN